MTRIGPRGFPLIVALGMVGCVHSPSDPGQSSSGVGEVVLLATTTGALADLDVDGYAVSGFASPTPISLRTNDRVTLPDVPAGTYHLTLDGIQSNCAARDEAAVTLRVPSDSTVYVSWSLVCGVIPSSLSVTFNTSTPRGIGAISITIDGGVARSLRAGATYRIDSLAPGPHTIAIVDSTPNCQTAAPRVREVTLVRQVAFHLDLPGACSVGRLLFSTLGGSRLWMMNADTSGFHGLPSLPPGVTASWPTMSPDGQSIAFIGPRNSLYIMRGDGTEHREIMSLPPNAQELVWSPDGTQLAFSGGSASLNDFEIFVVSVDGTGLRNLTNDPDRDQQPTWSPDGQRIAFMSHRAGGAGERNDRARIFTMHRDGSAIVPLSGPNGFYPAWAPDGAVIAFSSGGVLSTMTPTGAGIQGIPGVFTYLSPASWSPDGRMLVASRGAEIHFINRDGGSVVVTTPVDPVFGLTWVP